MTDKQWTKVCLYLTIGLGMAILLMIGVFYFFGYAYANKPKLQVVTDDAFVKDQRKIQPAGSYRLIEPTYNPQQVGTNE